MYADTSVYGGVFNAGCDDESAAFKAEHAADFAMPSVLLSELGNSP